MKKNKKSIEEKKPEVESEEEKVDVNSKEVVVERVEHGLIGTLRIEDEINSPFFKANDLAFIRYPSKLEKKAYVLYKDHDDYFLRRIMKYSDDGIYVAGDNERNYHLIKKDAIIGKVIGRQRKNKFKSINLNPSISLDLYTLIKYNLSYFRLKNRVIAYDDDINSEAFEIAKERLENVNDNKASNAPVIIQQDIEKDLDSELNYFINPDDLVIELQKEMEAQAIQEENERLEKERKLEEARRMVEEYDENNALSEEYIDDEDDIKEEAEANLDESEEYDENELADNATK